MAVPWTRFNLSWFTFGINYNLKPQPIIDTTLKGEKHYLKTYNSEYLKAFLGWNFTSIHNWGHQLQITMSPTISFSTARYFQDEDKISISKNQPYTAITGDTITKTEYTSVGFEKAYDRKLTWSVEFPVTFLWNKDNIGIDLAVKIGGNDPLNDNVGARFGIYIPVEIKDDAPVWIEPVIRVGKLFNDSNMDFWKDNVTVGFNLSIALKKFSITGK